MSSARMTSRRAATHRSSGGPARRGSAMPGCDRQGSLSIHRLRRCDRQRCSIASMGGPARMPGIATEDRSIGEAGPSSVAVSRATSAATSLMRSRRSAFSTRSFAHVLSASCFMAAISRCSLARSSLDCLSCSSIEAFSARIASVARRWRFSASASAARSSEFDLLCVRRLIAQAVGGEFAIGEKASLLVQPRVSSATRRARTSDSVNCAMSCRSSSVDAGAGLLRSAALLSELMAQRFTSAVLLRRRSCRSWVSMLIAFDLSLQGVGFGPQRDQFNALAVGLTSSCRENWS